MRQTFAVGRYASLLLGELILVGKFLLQAVIDSTGAVISLATVLHFVLQTFTLTHDYRLNSTENHEREFFKAKNAPHTKNSSRLIMIGF